MKNIVLKNRENIFDIYKMVIEDSLPNISTAQTINASKSGKERVDAYMKQIKSGKMGYMAAIKNIRTMLENGISENDLKIWSNMITDPHRVKKSMLLPFRFVDAWKSVKFLMEPEKSTHNRVRNGLRNELEKVFGDSSNGEKSINKKLGIVKAALERAFGLSAGNTNIIEEGEKIALLLDESCSMGGRGFYNQEEDKNQAFYIGKVLSAAIKAGLNEDDCRFYTWADYCNERNIKNESPFDFIERMNTSGGGTDVSAPLKKLIGERTYVDKIVILTDMQMYAGYSGNIGDQIKNHINKYKKTVNPNVKVLFWNLRGYGGIKNNSASPIDFEKTPGIFEVSGYSAEMLKIIPKLWNDKDYLIKEIEAVEL